MSIVTVRSLSCGYGSRAVVSDVNFSLSAGDYLCVVGENGAGKSTLIKTLVGLLPPISGEIDFEADKSELGYLPQRTKVPPDFPAIALEVVLSGCMNHSLLHMFHPVREHYAAMRALKHLGVEDLARKSFRELSGGQQQRVLLARSLLSAKKVLVLDEPVASLDPEATRDMYAILRKLNREDGITIIMVNHDVCCAVHEASHILHLGHNAKFFGTLAEYGKSDLGKAYLAAAGVIHGHEHHGCSCGCGGSHE